MEVDISKIHKSGLSLGISLTNVFKKKDFQLQGFQLQRVSKTDIEIIFADSFWVYQLKLGFSS